MSERAGIRSDTVAVELPSDLRVMLETEAERAGVPLPQYLCEAALARAIAASMLSTETRFERLAEAVREALADADGDVARLRRASDLVLAAVACLHARERVAESRALASQGEQAIRKTQE